MKTPAELAESFLDTPESHRRSSTRLKRLAGGLRSELRVQSNGFTQEEQEILVNAASLLDALSTNYTQAAALSKAQREKKDALEKQCAAAIKSTFGALTSNTDKVALIAAVQSYHIRNGNIQSQRDLDQYAKDAMDSLAYTLAGQVKDKTIEAVAAEAWQKFEGAKQGLIEKYQSVIDRITG